MMKSNDLKWYNPASIKVKFAQTFSTHRGEATPEAPISPTMLFNEHVDRIMRPHIEPLISQTGAHNQAKFSDGQLGFYIEDYPEVVLTPLFEYYLALVGFRIQLALEDGGNGIIFGRRPLFKYDNRNL